VISALVLRWVVTGLFVLSAAECVGAVVAKRRPWPWVISHGLHFVMAVAMGVMAWPRGARLPATGPMLFFLLATVVFATMAVGVARTTALRVLDAYSALMMLATAWMYAVMDGHLLPAGSDTQYHPQPGTAMPGMNMADMNMPTSSGSPLWFSAVNWFGTVTYAVAAAFWIYRYFIRRPHRAVWYRSLDNVGQMAMAAGMTILFLAILFPI